MLTHCPSCSAELHGSELTITAKSRCPKCGASLLQKSATLTALHSFPPSTQSKIGSTQDPESPRNPAPRSVGEYEILELLGGGGMGVVYRARHARLNRHVALKTIRSGSLATNEEIQRFKIEAEAAAVLDHPGIVPVHEVGEIDGIHFIAMGLAEGAPLSRIVRDAPLEALRAAQITIRVSRAVSYANQKGIIHRDIKPSNVIVDANDMPRIMDFGLAKQLGSHQELTATGQILGTPGYMAPEQIRPSVGDTGPPTDVYGLGALLYCLLTSRPPHQAASALDTIKLVLESDPVDPIELNPTIPRDLQTICLKCLEKTPAGRYTAASEVADDLERFLRDEPIVARPPSPIERLHKFAKRNRVFVRGAMVTLMTLVIGLIGTTIGLKSALEAAEFARSESVRANASERVAQQEEKRAKKLAGELTEEVTASYARLARLAMQRGEWQVAIDNLDRAVASGHPEASELLLRKCDVLCSQMMFSDALACLEPVLASGITEPEYGGALFRSGYVQLMRARSVDDADSALETIKDSLRFDLDSADEYYVRALLADDCASGLRFLDRALEDAPFDLKCWSLKFLYTCLAKGLLEGQRVLSTVRAIFPEDGAALLFETYLSSLGDDERRTEALLAQAREKTTQSLFEALSLGISFNRSLREATANKSAQSYAALVAFLVFEMGPKLKRISELLTEQEFQPDSMIGLFFARPFRPLLNIFPRMVASAITADMDAFELIASDLAKVSPTSIILSCSAIVQAAHADRMEGNESRLELLSAALLTINRAVDAPALVSLREHALAKRMRIQILAKIDMVSSPSVLKGVRNQDAVLMAQRDLPHGLLFLAGGPSGDLFTDAAVDVEGLLDGIALPAIRFNAPGYALEAIREYVKQDGSDRFKVELLSGVAFLRANAPLAAVRHLKRASNLSPNSPLIRPLLDKAREESLRLSKSLLSDDNGEAATR